MSSSSLLARVKFALVFCVDIELKREMQENEGLCSAVRQ